MFVCSLQNIIESRKGISDAILHEHLDTILQSWDGNRENFKDELIKDFSKGLETAIGLNNFSIYEMDKLKQYPEFKESIINGLYTLLSKERFVINDTHLYIGKSIGGSTLKISENEKNKIVKKLTHEMCYKHYDIILGRRVDLIVSLLVWFENEK